MKKRHAQELSRNQSILRFDVILQHDWPIEQCLHHIRVFFGGKTKSPCFDLFTYWLMKQITNTVPKPFFKVIRKSLYNVGKPRDWQNMFLSITVVQRGFVFSRLRFFFYILLFRSEVKEVVHYTGGLNLLR